MASLWWAFEACGLPSVLSLLVGIGASAFSAAALGAVLVRARAGRLMSWLSLPLALLPIGVGAAGMVFWRTHVNRMLGGGLVDPTSWALIRDERYRAADGCVAVGGAFSSLPLLLGMIAFGCVYLRRAAPTPQK